MPSIGGTLKVVIIFGSGWFCGLFCFAVSLVPFGG